MKQQKIEKRSMSETGSSVGLPASVTLPKKRLRVLIAGEGKLQSHFNHILAANIRSWGYEAVILSWLNLPHGGGVPIEGDVLIYDLDDSFFPAVGEEEGGKWRSFSWENHSDEQPGVRLAIVLSNRSISRDMLERMGAVALLHKPFEMELLQRYLTVFQKLLYDEPTRQKAERRVLRNGRRGSSRSSLSRQVSRRPRILVVDDHVEVARSICQCLEFEEQYEVKVANDGLQALEECLSWQPHCIITDLIMPWMNGFQVMRCLNAGASRSLPQVVVLSALMKHEFPLQRSYLRERAVVYVDKPFSIDQLLRAVAQALAQA